MPNLSTLAAPLSALASTKKYEWTDEHEKAFINLKKCLTSKPLKHFNKEWYTKIVVDASPIGLGCIVLQIDPDTGEVWVCFYGSRKTNEVEFKYSQLNVKCWAAKGHLSNTKRIY